MLMYVVRNLTNDICGAFESDPKCAAPERSCGGVSMLILLSQQAAIFCTLTVGGEIGRSTPDVTPGRSLNLSLAGEKYCVRNVMHYSRRHRLLSLCVSNVSIGQHFHLTTMFDELGILVRLCLSDGYDLTTLSQGPDPTES